MACSRPARMSPAATFTRKGARAAGYCTENQEGAPGLRMRALRKQGMPIWGARMCLGSTARPGNVPCMAMIEGIAVTLERNRWETFVLAFSRGPLVMLACIDPARQIQGASARPRSEVLP